ncbi:hypothetical protein N7490_003197 [Penicillium lividum]|nr:hypothetical protein N7490_003197 [Penicillium lividum]
MAEIFDHEYLAISKHRMRESLKPYVSERLHPLVSECIWSRIIVRGHYVRKGKNVEISATEKKDKGFNWQRPTAKILDDATLEISCFPGKDCVQHYAMLIAYHFALNGKDVSPTIEYFLPPIGDSMSIFLQSNLRLMGDVDTVVLGYVEPLAPTKEPAQWETGTDSTDEIFAWKILRQNGDNVVSFLACLVSLWGDILGDLIRALQPLNNVSCVLYMGKAGSLRPNDTPNDVLVTGEASYFSGQLITWDNALKPAISTAKYAKVCSGINVTVPTPLIETDNWFAQWEGKADWVDCEVGHAANACQEAKIKFGYLHIISDNVAQYHPQNLSTERQPAERLARKKILNQMQEILGLYLGLDDLLPSSCEDELHE